MADLPPLAVAADYVARYGALPADVDEDRVDLLLDDVSGQIREAAGWQQISLVADDVVTLVGGGRTTLVLPQLPVVEVAAVAGLSGTYWTHDGRGTITRLDGLTWDAPVTVTYTHGVDPVPSWLVGICCQAVRRELTNSAGLRASTVSIDDFSRTDTYATETVNTGVMLTDGERDRIASAYVAGVGSVDL